MSRRHRLWRREEGNGKRLCSMWKCQVEKGRGARPGLAASGMQTPGHVDKERGASKVAWKRLLGSVLGEIDRSYASLLQEPVALRRARQVTQITVPVKSEESRNRKKAQMLKGSL